MLSSLQSDKARKMIHFLKKKKKTGNISLVLEQQWHHIFQSEEGQRFFTSHSFLKALALFAPEEQLPLPADFPPNPTQWLTMQKCTAEVSRHW